MGITQSIDKRKEDLMSIDTKISNHNDYDNQIYASCEKFWYDRLIALTQENKFLKKENDDLHCKCMQLQWQLNTNELLRDFI